MITRLLLSFLTITFIETRLHPGNCNHRSKLANNIKHPPQSPPPLHLTDPTDLNRSSSGIPSASSNPLLTETEALPAIPLFLAPSSSITPAYPRSHRLCSESSSSSSSGARVARRLVARALEERPWLLLLLKVWSALWEL
jgi:hypothetical protein